VRRGILGRGYDEARRPRAFTPEEFAEVSPELAVDQHNREYRALLDALARWAVDTLGLRSSLEIGCGPRYLIHALTQLGVDAIGTGTDSCASRRPRHSPGARAAVGDLRAEAIALLPR
jgi:hypothetical protein